MQLTEDERAALERYRVLMAKMRGDGTDGSISGILRRCSREELSEQGSIGVALASMMIDRLFPVRTYGDIVIRWDDEITPERLVACGWKKTFPSRLEWTRDKTFSHAMMADFSNDGELFIRGSIGWDSFSCRENNRGIMPRNMLEVWQLMERCGIEEGGK